MRFFIRCCGCTPVIRTASSFSENNKKKSYEITMYSSAVFVSFSSLLFCKCVLNAHNDCWDCHTKNGCLLILLGQSDVFSHCHLIYNCSKHRIATKHLSVSETAYGVSCCDVQGIFRKNLSKSDAFIWTIRKIQCSMFKHQTVRNCQCWGELTSLTWFFSLNNYSHLHICYCIVTNQMQIDRIAH